LVVQFLAANPDSTLASEIRLVDQCGREGPGSVAWPTEVRRNPLAVLSTGRVLGAGQATAACAVAAFRAVLAMDSVTAAQPNALAARQAALVGEFAMHLALGNPAAADSAIAASVARGDGGSSLYLLAAPVAPSLAPQAAGVAARDSARFGDDLAGCSTHERCWLLGQYHAALGHARQAETVARVLAARVPGDSTGAVLRYARAAEAHARLARGDTSGAREAFRALLRSPFPPGAALTWDPIGGFARERLLLAQLLLAAGQPADARAVADVLDSAAPAVFLLYMRPSLELRAKAADALRDARAAATYRARLTRL
jgi:hypothetical protein